MKARVLVAAATMAATLAFGGATADHVGVANLMHIPIDCGGKSTPLHPCEQPYGWEESRWSTYSGRPTKPWSCVRGAYFVACSPVPAGDWDTADLDTAL